MKVKPAIFEFLARRKVLDAAIPAQIEVEKTIVLVVMIRNEDSEGLKKIVRIKASEKRISLVSFPWRRFAPITQKIRIRKVQWIKIFIPETLATYKEFFIFYFINSILSTNN